MKKIVRKVLTWTALIAMCLLVLTGCERCKRPAVVVQVETNETAILVDMRASEASAIEGSVESRRDIRIGGYWVQTGRFDYQGHWRPTHRVLVVSRRPVNVIWTDERGGNGTVARAVSKGQAGFRVPLVINALIPNDEAAQLYLRFFRSSEDVTDRTSEGSKYWRVREEARDLEDVLNKHIFPIVQSSLIRSFRDVETIEAESRTSEFVLRALADAQVEADKYGITILSLASTDGVLFDDNAFQVAINNRAVLQMQEDVLEQERRNALVAQRVAQVEAETRQRVAAIEAQTASSRQILQRIENEKLIAEATARAIEAGRVVPSGSYPVGWTSLIITPNYNSLSGGNR